MLWVLGIGVAFISCLLVDGLISERRYLRSFAMLYQRFLSLAVSSLRLNIALVAVKRWKSGLPSLSFRMWQSKGVKDYDELMAKYRATVKEKASLKLECDRLRVAQALTRADHEAAGKSHLSLVQRHVQARFLAKNLASQNEILSDELDATHASAKKRTFLLRLSLNLLGLFWHYVQMATKRNRILTDSNISLHSRISQLLSSNLVLRKFCVEAEGSLEDARKTVNELTLKLESEETIKESLHSTILDLSSQNEALKKERNALIDGRTVLQDALNEATNDSQFFQALSKSIVARYDRLQTEHGNLLIKHDLVKSDIFAFRDDLSRVATQVQETQDLAEIGLNDLHRSVKPLKTKQDLLRIGQSLALVRLTIAELLQDVVSFDSRDTTGSLGEGSTLLEGVPCTPGSIEDAVRKIKKLYEANESSEELDRSFVISDTSSSKDYILDDSASTSADSFDSSHRLRPMMEGIQKILCEIEKREASTDDLTNMLKGLDSSPKFRTMVDAPRSLDNADILADLLTRTPTEDNSFGSVSESDLSTGSHYNTQNHRRRSSVVHNPSNRFPKMISLLEQAGGFEAEVSI